jgi:hypothetical protein
MSTATSTAMQSGKSKPPVRLVDQVRAEELLDPSFNFSVTKTQVELAMHVRRVRANEPALATGDRISGAEQGLLFRLAVATHLDISPGEIESYSGNFDGRRVNVLSLPIISARIALVALHEAIPGPIGSLRLNGIDRFDTDVCADLLAARDPSAQIGSLRLFATKNSGVALTDDFEQPLNVKRYDPINTLPDDLPIGELIANYAGGAHRSASLAS